MGTATRTVLFTDLANYTAAVSRTDREGLRRILTEHQDLVSPIVTRYGGRIVKNLGDSFMCLFPSATDGLRASLDIQDVVQSHGTMSIRVGLTTGDVEEIDGDAFGDSVNLAARILGQTPASEVWFGHGTWACMNAAEIPWDSVGRFRLKGIPGEADIYRVVPQKRCYLPEAIVQAVRTGHLVRVRRGQPVPPLPPEPVLLLDGFPPGSPALSAVVDTLPVLDPTRLWLNTYNISATDRHTWTESGRGLVIGTPDALENALADARKVVTRSSGSDTIVLDMGGGADVELVVAGLALPAVPLSEVVASYFYDLLPDGRWAARSDRAILRVEVSPSGASIQTSVPGVSVSGRRMNIGEQLTLSAPCLIHTPAGDIQWRPTDAPYVGVLLSDTPMRLGVVQDQSAELGREPNHPGLAFPDRRGQDNIRWCPGNRAARARAGGFTLDRALAGRHQASVTITADGARINQIHDRCATYIQRPQSTVLTQVTDQASARMDDLLIAGTTVVALRRPDA